MSELARQYPDYFPARPWKRVIATGIDGAMVWVLSAVAAVPGQAIQWGQILVFLLAWWVLRVAVVYRNKGQSLGHWLMDLRVIDQRGRTPLLQRLTQREGILGGLVLLALVAVDSGLGFAILLLVAPVIVDCSWAWINPRHNTLHDLISQTEIVVAYRGFSLDRKLIRLSQQIRAQRSK
ncbi:RDD family protein [Thermosynechococcaceae cyanobacterium BACA0444]|uniref:RDD family protein n=1 Tax=Pseudocalidococcus azoricus BACA0444 TaxID=2918990 RepID=A0AAE4FQZ3_9CYAN|nr:RDD family protein [Pseudocalidococcus azoricus]MDS3859420.1 RDD family protein [Pseudocalidococcus azoricus BACA0444]